MLLQVEVPGGLSEGELFNVEACGQIFEICVPDGVQEGELIEVDLPVEQSALEGPVVVEIAVPDDAAGGSEILVDHEGTQFYVVIPEGLQAGDIFAVEVPQPTGQGAEVEPPQQQLVEAVAGVSFTPPASPGVASPGSGDEMKSPGSRGAAPTPSRRRRRKSSGFESWVSFPLITKGKFDLQQAVEVYRSDGTWSAARVDAYDELGDTYELTLQDGRVKHMVESDYIRNIKVGGYNKHQAVRVLEKTAWVWARVDDFYEDDSSYFGSYSIELLDGQKRYSLEATDIRQVPRTQAGG